MGDLGENCLKQWFNLLSKIHYRVQLISDSVLRCEHIKFTIRMKTVAHFSYLINIRLGLYNFHGHDYKFV